MIKAVWTFEPRGISGVCYPSFTTTPPVLGYRNAGVNQR